MVRQFQVIDWQLLVRQLFLCPKECCWPDTAPVPVKSHLSAAKLADGFAQDAPDSAISRLAMVSDATLSSKERRSCDYE
jgi:hypothetical protein